MAFEIPFAMAFEIPVAMAFLHILYLYFR